VARTVEVHRLQKFYKTYKKEPGLRGAIASFFSRKYEEVKAVDGVSFEINEGELVGFVGPNGAGKTTTLKVLSGLLYPTSGVVRVLGFDPWERRDDYLRQISLVMGQKNQLWWDLPAIDSFLLNKEIYEISDVEFKKNLTELVSLLEVEDLMKVQVRRLSLGERMKMELVAALLHSPRVLFLDEPTIGLDVVAQKKMREFILSYNKKRKATIILTSHYMEDVKELARRVIIIDKGKIIFDGELAEVTKRFAGEKIITAVFSRNIDVKKLSEVGEVISYDFPKAKVGVKRDVAPLAAAELLRHFPVADITIEEMPIEEIIREIFSGKRGVS